MFGVEIQGWSSWYWNPATSDLYVSALVEIGLVLFVITLGVNAIARVLIARVRRAPGAARP